MLAQLDLFSSPGEQDRKIQIEPVTETRKLIPPAVIHVQKPGPVMEMEENSVPATVSMPSAPIEFISTVDAPVESSFTESSQTEDSTGTGPAFIKTSTRGRKSIREMSLEAARIEVPADDILFAKQYYGIGEVAAMFQVNASLLRYWETEFEILKPRKNKKGDRFFRPEDIKNLQLIHHLLREKKYTIEGAKDFLKKSKKSSLQFEAIESLKKIKSFLLEMKAGLSVAGDS